MRVLQLEMTTAAGGDGLICQPITTVTPIVPGMAVELIQQIDATTPQSVGNHDDYALLLRHFFSGMASFVTPPDQNGWGSLGQAEASYSWMRGRWYHRVISLDAYAGPYTLEGVQLRAKGSAAGTYRHRYAQVSVTKYRRPLLWGFRDGMPMPDVSTLATVGSPTYQRACMLEMHEHFPLVCTTLATPDQTIDNVSKSRSSGGRGRRWVEWDGARKRWPLEFVGISEMERQALEAFYTVYRGGSDWFFWQHRVNYPAQRAIFTDKPPEIVPTAFNGGDMRYRARVEIEEL